MKTYWDLSGPERAALSHEDVARFVDVELMRAGCLKAPSEPRLLPVPARPKPLIGYAISTKRDSYRTSTSDVLFVTRADAEHASLECTTVEHDYKIDCRVATNGPRSIVEVEYLTPAMAAEQRRVLEQIKGIEAENERIAREYTDAVAKQEKALDGMWSDWNEQRDTDHRLRKVGETFDEYLRLSGGDVVVAARFLSKAFDADEIREASKWLGRAIPFAIDMASEAAPMPEEMPA